MIEQIRVEVRNIAFFEFIEVDHHHLFLQAFFCFTAAKGGASGSLFLYN